MSASDHLSKEQFELHRGINLQLAGGKISKKGVGVNWTANHDYAKGWAIPALNPATEEDYYDEEGSDFNWNKTKGTVLHGTVSKRAVLKPGTEEHAKMADEYASAGEGDELLVRPNAKIKVHKETRIRYNADAPEGETTYKTRTRTYKPPRKMTA
jgi:hypothetical protein